MKCGALGENQVFLRKFRYGVYMFTKNIFQNIVVKWVFDLSKNVLTQELSEIA